MPSIIGRAHVILYRRSLETFSSVELTERIIASTHGRVMICDFWVFGGGGGGGGGVFLAIYNERVWSVKDQQSRHEQQALEYSLRMFIC